MELNGNEWDFIGNIMFFFFFMGFNGNITSIFSTKLTNHNYFFDASDNGYLPEWQRFIGKTMIDQLFLGQFGAARLYVAQQLELWELV
jgi:hypothetical protein